MVVGSGGEAAVDGDGSVVAAHGPNRSLGNLALAFILVVAACRPGGDRAPALAGPTRHFDSPEAAASAFIDAAGRFDVPELIAMLGEVGEPLFSSEDAVLDRERAVTFAEEARAQHRITLDSTGRVATLSVGAGDWPAPIPIVQDGGGQWTFDATAGVHEVLLRRIGENELDAIRVARGFVEAQREYARERHDGARINQFAQKIVSSPGTRDGLAWRDADGRWRGPVGEVVAQAIEQGYTDRREPFHGYYFKVLKGQGPHARFGEVDFVVGGAMIGGFGLVAAPAEYGVTGIASFIVNQDGVVYQKDLGDGTLDAFKAMERFDPDSTWTPVPD